MVTVSFEDDAPEQKTNTGEKPGVKVTYADPPADIKSAEGSLRALEKNLIAVAINPRRFRLMTRTSRASGRA